MGVEAEHRGSAALTRMKTKSKSGEPAREKGRMVSVRRGRLVRRLRALEKRWLKEAAGFHRMGREDVRAGRMLGKEYMAVAACWRSCAKELKQARTPNTKLTDAQRSV